MESKVAYENGLNLKATELRLGLPGADIESEEQAVSSARNNKRPLPDNSKECGLKGSSHDAQHSDYETAPPAK